MLMSDKIEAHMKNNIIDDLIRKNNGTITSREVRSLGIPSVYLTYLVRKGSLQRIGRGVYLSATYFGDEFYALQRQFQSIVFSHDTSLFFHGFGEKKPTMIDVCVYSGYNTHRFPIQIKTHYVSKKNHRLGVATLQSPQGNEVTCYDLERTICDIARTNKGVDIEIRNENLRSVFRNANINYQKLYAYAEQLRCQRKIKLIIEWMS